MNLHSSHYFSNKILPIYFRLEYSSNGRLFKIDDFENWVLFEKDVKDLPADFQLEDRADVIQKHHKLRLLVSFALVVLQVIRNLILDILRHEYILHRFIAFVDLLAV